MRRPGQCDGTGDHHDVVEAGALDVVQGPLPHRPATQESEQLVLAAGETRPGAAGEKGGDARHEREPSALNK